MDMGKSDIYNSIDKKKDTSKGAHQINRLDYITKERKMLNTHDIIKAVENEFNRIDIPEKKFHSDHEAWAVLLEEIYELGSESRLVKHHSEYLKTKIFLDSDDKSKLESLDHIYEYAVLAAAEAVQVAAVATKFIKKKEQVAK